LLDLSKIRTRHHQSGNGNGDGDGDGYGSGSGYGDGDGGGDGYWRAVLRQRANGPEPHAFWWSDEAGQPCNNGRPMQVAAPGVVHESPGPLVLCQPGTLHSTLRPTAWKGQRLWIVKLHGEVVGDEEKFGCLKREIVCEVEL